MKIDRCRVTRLMGCALVVAACSAGRAGGAEVTGPCTDGTYAASNGDRLRYFTGIYTGEFTPERITAEAKDLLGQMRKADKSAETFPNGSERFDPDRRFLVVRGDVLVVGWSNETSGDWGWMAVHNDDATDRVTPRFQVLTSNGQRHMIRGVPAEKNQSCSASWPATRALRDRQSILVVASTDVVRVFFPN